MALSAERRLRIEKWSRRKFTGTATKLWKGGLAAYDQSLGKVVEVTTGATSTDQFILGTFYETVDASAADAPVVVNLKREVTVVWMKNDGTNPVTVNDIGKPIFGVDDETVSILNTNRSTVGIAWAVDATLGVAVEMT